ncbi:hypothetical protein [Cellulomonas sp. PS-H5]|uniref:hypothetical protein n=1 Tax=Cellulomonas sp. PS-H5 TaxID=2820400 RepID=UPI001C4FAD5E|nr:hypothetical protein [Cellulomonas sp. PS-H5]MBW0254963.1 hypothetical protein [Cellulomonas sp. PS-H5]
MRGCGADLYAVPDAAVVTCRACGARYDAPARRAWHLEQARDLLLPARDIARAVDGLGVDISLDTVKSWVHRKRLVGHGHVDIRDGRTAATHQVGDVLDPVQASADRRRAVPA